MPFFDKELSKAIMTRTKTYNNLLKSKGEENKKVYANQRNFCVPHFRKIKKRYYWNLNENSVIDNNLFWKTVKPFLSDKILGTNKIHFNENVELNKADLETGEILNDFFSKIVQNLGITRYPSNKPLGNMNDSTKKAIAKYRNHGSILAKRNQYKNRACFSFTERSWKKEVEHLI